MQDPAVPNEGKDVFDWVKEDNLTRLRECLQTKIRLVNEPDAEGMTLLHWACDRGHQQAVSLLLDYGADVNLQDAEGQTPLHYGRCPLAGRIQGTLNHPMMLV